MALSVIVASYNAHHTLRCCLESLSNQPEANEIVVADCSPADPAPELSAAFPNVKFVHFDCKMTIPELRWAAYQWTSGEIIAATEARCVPSSTWCADIIQAHEEASEAPGIGGPIMVRLPATAFEAGLFLCEYGMHCPPPVREIVSEVSGANVSYKRAALDSCRDLIDAGAWETAFHLRWKSQGQTLRTSPALVTFHNSMDFRTALRQRFDYGRGYGSERVKTSSWPVRITYGAASLLLPAVMMLRIGRVAFSRSKADLFLRSLPYIIVLSASWSLGEMVGYLAGPCLETKVY